MQGLLACRAWWRMSGWCKWLDGVQGIGQKSAFLGLGMTWAWAGGSCGVRRCVSCTHIMFFTAPGA